MITILEKFLTGLERGGGLKAITRTASAVNNEKVINNLKLIL